MPHANTSNDRLDPVSTSLGAHSTASSATSLEQISRFAAETGLTRREAEITLLERGIVPERYGRNIGTLGIDGQLALRRATAVVVGCGGLGGWLAEGLCRLGIGRLRLIDGDVFQGSNLNRQLGCTEHTLGHPKASALAEHLRGVNGAVDIEPLDMHLTETNARHLLDGASVVLDALDSIYARIVLQRAARHCSLPLIHGAIAGWTGQVMTILPDDPGLEAIYGDVPPQDHGVENETGTPTPTPMLVAAWMLQECAKLLSNRSMLLRGRLLILDSLYGDATAVDLG